jgi:eukaryotic-like serine/threonine-protein kinase
MGEVYRAHDPRLGRDVALKVLPADVSGDPSRRRRFEQEARAVAALNHPNIVGIYDVGQSPDQPLYIASELIEGESLRDRIRRSQISIRELYRIAVQLADGMAAAHAAGITHRDLKPENVMLTTDGRVKILDFGLARQAPAPRASSATAPSDATLTQVETQPGTILGTVAYMSPEQVRGLPLDPRSDQFSFGSILYEMATGNRPFASETTVQTMSAVLTEEPKPVDPKIPAPLRWTIARCLEKDATARYESTRDLYHELRGQQEHLSDVFTSTEAPAGLPPAATRSWWPKAAVAVATLSLAVAAGAVWWAFHRAPGIGRYRFTPMEVSWPNAGLPIWSPDGKAFAYVAQVNGIDQVFIRYLNSPTPVQLTHAGTDMLVAGWAADSKRVFSWGKNPAFEPNTGKPPNAIFSTPVFGGEPGLLLTADVVYAAVSPDGKALAAVVIEDNKRVVKTSTPVGAPFQRYSPAPFETKDQYNAPSLQFSPNGQRILLFIDQSKGRLVWNLPWPAGRSVPKQAPLRLPYYGGTPRFTWLPDSRHIIVSLQERADNETRHLWVADVDSGAIERQITSGTSSEFEPALSPNGKQLLFQQYRIDNDFVSVSLENAAAERTFSSELLAATPAWAPRQDKFVYVTHRNGPAEIWSRGDGRDQPLVTPASFPPGTTTWFMNPALSPSGDTLIYSRIDSSGRQLLWISSFSGGPPVRLTNDQNPGEEGGSWSPDGKSFTYLQYQNGHGNVMTIKTTGEAPPVLLQADVASFLPEWSPDGQWIKFMDGHGNWTLMSPDGKTKQEIGPLNVVEMAFSKDSHRLYGIREDNGRGHLLSLDLATKQQKNIGDLAKDFVPSSYLSPGMRLSLSPDGKSILYPVFRTSASLWMLEGFE